MSWFSQNSARLGIALVLAASGATFTPASATDSSAPTLTTKTTTDETASVGIPAGWKFVKGSNGFVYVTGPHDERINLGVIVIGKNANAGSDLGGEVAFALPFSASSSDKFSAILQAGAAKQGQPAPQITFASATRTRLPMCSFFVGGLTGGLGSRKFEAVLCSLAPDYLGLYKNIVFLAQVPTSLAMQDRPIVQKIVQSYRVTPTMFKKMLAPYTPTPPAPVGAPAFGGMAPYQDPTNSDCFDYNVIRESPPWEMPMHCGGYQPG
jgi:hypothetical protein